MTEARVSLSCWKCSVNLTRKQDNTVYFTCQEQVGVRAPFSIGGLEAIRRGTWRL